MSLLDFLSDLANPSLAFLPRALLIAVLSSLVCGLVGAHVVLRGLSFVGDALSHAVFPGIALEHPATRGLLSRSSSGRSPA